ncbi:hypothetical protein HOC80_04315 [archaeon]|jgi:hypothetical protein|nr:hypothetical protein [archaeon]
MEKVIWCIAIDWDERKTLKRFWEISGRGLRSKIPFIELDREMNGSEGYKTDSIDWDKLAFAGNNKSNVKYYPVLEGNVHLYEWYFKVD